MTEALMAPRAERAAFPPHDVGIVHDYVTQRGGAERVVLELLRAFPRAPLYTSLYNPDGSFEEFSRFDLVTSPLNRVPAFRHRHRLAFPALAPTFSSWRIDHDIVICSSSGWAHAVRTAGRKVVYCHAPARWLYQPAVYVERRDWPRRAVLAIGSRPLRAWDRRAMLSADALLANSEATRAAILRIYGRDVTVVHPPHAAPVDVAPEPVQGIEPGFSLVVSRLLPYKNVDAVVDAFRMLREQLLVVVGTGPEESRLRSAAPSNVTFLGQVSDGQLAWLYGASVNLIAASYEDFGLTPLEAAAFGKPTAALRFGGYLETIVEGETGTFFDRPDPETIAAAVRTLSLAELSEPALKEHAASFSPDAFARRVRAAVGVPEGTALAAEAV